MELIRIHKLWDQRFPTVMLNHEQTVQILVLVFSKTKEIYDNFRHSSFTHIGIFCHWIKFQTKLWCSRIWSHLPKHRAAGQPDLEYGCTVVVCNTGNYLPENIMRYNCMECRADDLDLMCAAFHMSSNSCWFIVNIVNQMCILHMIFQENPIFRYLRYFSRYWTLQNTSVLIVYNTYNVEAHISLWYPWIVLNKKWTEEV